jgi:hypothetical protein
MPVTYADLVAVWGAGNVVRLPAIGPEFAQLPDGAQCVLTEVGVPKEADAGAGPAGFQRPGDLVVGDLRTDESRPALALGWARR